MYSFQTKMAKLTGAIAKTACLISVSLTGAIAFNLPSMGQTSPNLSLRSEKQLSDDPEVIFKPPTDEQANDSRGAASRTIATRCREDRASDIPLTALIPDSHQGLTIASHPTLFVYVPPTSAQHIYFNLKDQNNLELYQTMLPISGQEGVVSIQWPSDRTPLEIGQTYDWSVVLICHYPQTDMPSVTGRVRRVELDATFASNNDETSNLERATFYAKSGIWYDTLSTLFQLQLSANENNSPGNDPSFFSQTWANVLTSVGLEEVAEQPLLTQP